MILFKKANELRVYIDQQKQRNFSLAFVPTMGALHQGHISLLKSAQAEDVKTICSIFVNPVQFNNPQDFKKYPVTLESDLEKLYTSGCDAVFLPTVEEVYPPHYKPTHFDLGDLELILEGRFRPGHFQGVCQVMDQLLTIVQPDKLYLGAKDYQQCMVIERLLSLTHRNEQTSIVIMPTIREKDGLAMSSRNLRLTESERQQAPELYKTLKKIAAAYHGSNALPLEQEGTLALQKSGFRIDYLQIANAKTLQPAVPEDADIIVLVAAYIDDIRLIDNLPISQQLT